MRPDRRPRGARPAVGPLEGRPLLAAVTPLALTGLPVSALTGSTTGLVPVASFVDPTGSAAPAAGQYNATISWGDGTFSDGFVTIGTSTANASGGTDTVDGTVLGAHFYAQSGTYPVVVALARGTLASGSARTTATATGLGVPGAGVNPLGPIAATVGGTTGPTLVGSFNDPIVAPIPTGVGIYSAEIDWGDGTQTPGQIAVTPGSVGSAAFSTIVAVTGAHTYVAPGTYPVTVALARQGLAFSYTDVAVVTGTALPLNQVIAPPLPAGRAGQATDLGPLAYFVDSVASAGKGKKTKAPGYTAIVEWGDGSYSTGTALATPGPAGGGRVPYVVAITAGHVYAAPGTYPITVALGRTGLALSATNFATVT